MKMILLALVAEAFPDCWRGRGKRSQKRRSGQDPPCLVLRVTATLPFMKWSSGKVEIAESSKIGLGKFAQKRPQRPQTVMHAIHPKHQACRFFFRKIWECHWLPQY